MSVFHEKMLKLCKELLAHKDHVTGNEQATKEHLIGPFFSELGWKRDPKTWKAEYDADFNGKKKGEKVDYAILRGDSPIMLIECKAYSTKDRALSARDGQLARYFAATPSKLSVITNGIIYRFFTDLNKDNIQDIDPFFVFDCGNPTATDLNALELFTPSLFNVQAIRAWAIEHQFLDKVRFFLKGLISKPHEAPGFALYLLEHTHADRRSKAIVQRLNDHLPELVNEVLGEEIRTRFASANPVVPLGDSKGIVTTPEELAALGTIKGILAGAGKDPDLVTFRDMKNWMNISLRHPGNWFIRLFFNESPKGILFRLSQKEISPFFPADQKITTKGKNAFIEIDPARLPIIAMAIVAGFEARIQGRDGVSEMGDEEDSSLSVA